jgi:hypothetical protein
VDDHGLPTVRDASIDGQNKRAAQQSRQSIDILCQEGSIMRAMLLVLVLASASLAGDVRVEVVDPTAATTYRVPGVTVERLSGWFGAVVETQTTGPNGEPVVFSGLADGSVLHYRATKPGLVSWTPAPWQDTAMGSVRVSSGVTLRRVEMFVDP